MSNLSKLAETIRRPGLLIRAAQAGLAEYDRNRDLARLTRHASPPSPDVAVRCLIAAEKLLETCRKAGNAGYSHAQHITLLTALMGELRLLKRQESA
jgi:hypothetical protein